MYPYYNYPFDYYYRNNVMVSPFAPQNAQYAPVYQPPVPSFPPKTAPEIEAEMEDFDNVGKASGQSSPGDPPPIITNPIPVPGTFLLKELTGYSNYGMPSGNADILYTGNRGAWTFRLPSWLPRPQNLTGQLLLTAVLDDHANVPVTDYSMTIAINGTVVRQGAIALEHGTPAGGRFVNWRVLTYPIANLRANNRIVITNTSTAGPNDWIGIDWMELRLFYR